MIFISFDGASKEGYGSSCPGPFVDYLVGEECWTLRTRGQWLSARRRVPIFSHLLGCQLSKEFFGIPF